MTVTYYLGGVLDGSLLTTANDVSIASGATAVGKDTPIGTLTGYGELVPNNAPGTFPAYGSEAAVPWSGKGQIYPVSLLNQAHLDGNWTPTLKCSVQGTSPSSITADLIFRVWIWNSVSNIATKYGVITLAAQTITTTSTSFVFSAGSLPVIAPPTANDYLSFDTVINVTSNPNGSGVGLKVRTNFSNSTSQGNATGQVVAPALVPARIIPMASALQGTYTRTIPMHSSLAFTRNIPMASALSGNKHRVIPMASSVCGAALANPYVQTISDTHFVSSSGPHLIYKGNQIKLYGATCYLATQGGANTWLNTDASAVLNDLFVAAYNNGVSMIRLTDYWDGSHVSAIDLPQLWANIDYCVTRAQQLGMFVMMDVSAYKNVLIAAAIDWTVASNWHDWLTFVGYHFRNTATSICWYNCIGEPSVPADQAGCNALAAFYGYLCDTVHAADNGTHLIEAGGLTHMNQVVGGLTDPAWWYQIYTLANNNICGYKTYSTNDLVYLSTIRSIMTTYSINKPLANNEFGAEQEQGDQTFPAFTNTLNATITGGVTTVTSLALHTAISQTILAGTIISVSGTENFVVATTTSSGTSLPVASVTAQQNHANNDSVVALSFADTGHSLGDTVYNFYSAVLGLTTTINKWNGTPRTLVATSVMGGDQAGTVSYVVWNLGYSSNPTSYDVSSNVSTSPISWALYGSKSRLDGYQPIPPLGAFTIMIGSQAVEFDESTFTIAYKENEAWRCQFTVLDYSGNQVFPYRSKIKITDPLLGILFTGFLIDDVFDKSNSMHNTLIEHKIDCIGNESKPMKRTSNRLYTVPFPAAQGVIDMLNDTLVAEGVSAKYALSEVNTQALWNAGTLSGATGASNLPGGDLELSPAGSTVTITEATTSDFAAGTLTDVTATSNTLQLVSTQAIKVTGTAVDAHASGANLYSITKIWNGSQSTASGDYLEYSIWISSTSSYIAGGVDIINTDGTTWRAHVAEDQNLFLNVNYFPTKGSLVGFADDQWYYRKVTIPTALVGKTIRSVTVNLTDNTQGTYTFYVKNIYYRDSGGGLKATFYSSGATNTLQQLSNSGYNNVAVTTPTTYEKSGTRISSAHSLSAAAIASLSLVSWSATTQTQPKSSGEQLTIETSLDGGASWQLATNRGKVPGLIPGQVLTSRTLTVRETLAIAGSNPELAPILSGLTTTINSAPTASKTDVFNADTTGNMGTGTVVALTNDSTGLYISGSYKDWIDGDATTGQTVYGSGTPANNEAYGTLLLSNASTSVFTAERFDFAGQHQNFTSEMDVYLYPVAGITTNLIYRSNHWGNVDGFFAYEAQLEAGGLHLFTGQDNTSGGATTQIGTTTGVTFATDAWYRLKVVVSGTSHKIYVDDVEYLNMIDSFYTGTGYLGCRIGIGVNAAVGYFNNFGVQDVMTGSRIAPSVSISGVGTVLDSFIDWASIVPDNCTLDIQASTNGGSTYTSCTRGGEIPGCTPTTNVAGLSLLIKAVFTANNANVTPLLLGIGWSVSGAYSSSGSYTSPSLSLATAGQVGNTLVAWAGLEPTNTTILADTTIDGGSSWQTNVAPGTLVTAGGIQYAGLGTIANITTQPDPTVDGFSTDTSANYTVAHGSGGSDATWTTDTVNSRVVAVGGSKAFYAYTSVSVLNMDLLCDMTRSDAGGLVWCYSDATDYYSVLVADSQSTVATPNTLTLYRNGVSVASATIVFTRGLIYRLRASIAAGVINVSFDGATLITYTDGTPLVAGKAGLFNNGGTADFIGLWLQPLGDDVTSLNAKARIRLTSTDPTATPQVQTLSFGAYGPQINTGTLIPSADYRQTYLNSNLDDLAKQSNYAWHIDQLNALNFTQSQAKPAPWILQSNTLSQPSDLELDSNLAIETLGDLYRNRQVLKGVINSAIFEDDFTGNGFATSFTLRYPIATGTFPTIVLNGQTQTIGLKGASGANFYYAVGDLTIAQDGSALVLSGTDTGTISYTGTFTDTVTRNNTSAQTALALAEGGTGIIEAVEDVSSKNMSYDAAVTYGDQLLARYCITGRLATFKTYRNGLAVGQMLPAYIPEEDLLYAQLLIHQIDLYMQTQPNNTVLYNYLVQASELPALASWPKLIASGLLE